MPTTTHIYIVGMTQSGKTLAAKSLCTSTRISGRGVIVYDPTACRSGANANGWRADLVTNDFDRFERVFWASRGCLAVIDEAADVFAEERKRARPMVTRGRHNGHVVCMISQRHKIMDKTAREQCSSVFCFNVNRDDAAELALDWNCDMLATAYQLPMLHYIHYQRFAEPRCGVVKIPGRKK